MKKLFVILFTILLTTQIIFAQDGSQTIRGTVTDKQSEITLIGAAIEVLTVAPIKGTTSDIDGDFSITGIPAGRHEIRISYLGYNSITLPNILVTSGKEVYLEIGLEESLEVLNEIVVTAEVEKDKATNEMATISARTFSLEEVTRYSGGANDVSRMVSNYAGVSGLDDNRNDIVIRGNSPTGVLWRLEGIPIPNPNHFSTFGTTGGPVSALNTNLLKNSDFMTSAFPAEYGNANAGVFDISFRNGNKEKYEFTAQLAAFSGLEVMVEGPLSKKKKSSFIIAYRNSFVALAQEVGLNVGTNALPDYRDLTFKLDFANTKIGKFSFFGIGGVSDINFLNAETDEDDIFANDGEVDSYVTSGVGIIGMNHRYLIDDRSYIRTTLSASTSQNTFNEDTYLDEIEKYKSLELDDKNSRFSISSYWNKKFNAKHTMRVGVLGEYFKLNNNFNYREEEFSDWIRVRDFNDGIGLLQTYAQSQYKVSDKWTINSGLHLQYLSFNDDLVVEPRLAFNYHITPNSTINFGYGMHNQMQPLPIYLNETLNQDGSYTQTNKDLDFSRSNHLVLGYDHKFGTNWRLKTEAYYQLLDKIGVESIPSSFSVINVGADFGFPDNGNLVAEGTGKNYGLELTVEKFFSDGYYGLLSASLFDSKYTASDDIERNTSFNNNWIVNVLAGKEWYFSKDKRNAITTDFRLQNAGGRAYTPIDLEASKLADEAVEDLDNAYSERYPNYFRLDIKIGYRLNSPKRKLSQTFYLDFRNVTNNKNVFIYRYNATDQEVKPVYQIGFFPDILYRVQF